MQPRAVLYISEIFKFYHSFFLLYTYYSILTTKPTYSLYNTPDSVSPTVQISPHLKYSHIVDSCKSYNTTSQPQSQSCKALVVCSRVQLSSLYHSKLPSIALSYIVPLQCLIPLSITQPHFLHLSKHLSIFPNISSSFQASLYLTSPHLIVSNFTTSIS